MIRASDYLSNLAWPWDEKRWPFYSVLLIPGVISNTPILWGRIVAVIVSVFTLLIVYLYYLRYISKTKKYAILSVLLLALSSVFAYWSIRVMADLIFAFLIISFNFVFIKYYKKSNIISKYDYLLSVTLILITMTRLEGLFMLIGVIIYFAFRSSKLQTLGSYFKSIIENRKILVIYLLPQVIIYLPFTLYAKVLYNGPVNNDYLEELSTFSFDITRLIYFLTYTLNILVIPILGVCIVMVLYKFIKSKKYSNLGSFLPVSIFIALELIVGFIWTPSLPRIYMPIIPFAIMYAVNFLETKNTIKNKAILILGIIYIVQFTVLQSYQKLYFLGASKILFILIIVFSFVISFSLYYFGKNKVFYSVILFLSLLISSTIIYNQKDIYKSVAKTVEFLANSDGKIAFSDETGLTSWYLRDNSIYLDQKIFLDSENQYRYLKENKVDYLLVTNEFNRGSKFNTPNKMQNYELIFDYKVVINDLLTKMVSTYIDNIGLNETEFVTQLYIVK